MIPFLISLAALLAGYLLSIALFIVRNSDIPIFALVQLIVNKDKKYIY